MIRETDKELYAQCLRSIKQGISFNQYPLPETPVEEFAERIARQISANRVKGRVHQDKVCDPVTGVPSSYINVIISYTLEVGPKIELLKAGDVKSWNEIEVLVRRRVNTNLRCYASLYGHRYEHLAKELVQHCMDVLWIRLDGYTYDTDLESWVSQFVALEVSTERRKSDFKWNSTARSLDQPIGFGEGISTLGELLPDRNAVHHYEQIDLYLSVQAASKYLSPDQHEVIWRTLSGQTSQDIADHMGKNRNTIYQIRYRAVKTLREYID
ncbi:MAG: sigma-70 family RNA polymerase sigma factor [Anaerolineae bacterium]|nr:sigma-70 family RNA polymerase sigma factor [Anaerolineae bacterium]